ncbi:MAG TPA: hypothetical protein DCY95_16750 [Algoriphagus sp.]|nr:hypothetical protein [Algoriphagus sp.]
MILTFTEATNSSNIRTKSLKIILLSYTKEDISIEVGSFNCGKIISSKKVVFQFSVKSDYKIDLN